jgi:hypothetical protein
VGGDAPSSPGLYNRKLATMIAIAAHAMVVYGIVFMAAAQGRLALGFFGSLQGIRLKETRSGGR